MKEIIDKHAFKAMQEREAEARATRRKAELLAVIAHDINRGTVNSRTVACLDEYFTYIGHSMEINANGLVQVSSAELLRGLARLARQMDHDITCSDLEDFL